MSGQSDDWDGYQATNKGSAYSTEVLDKGMIYIANVIEWDGARFLNATQNNAQLKAYELFVSGVFHLTFSVWLTVGN